MLLTRIFYKAQLCHLPKCIAENTVKSVHLLFLSEVGHAASSVMYAIGVLMKRHRSHCVDLTCVLSAFCEVICDCIQN